jgi:plastocyanin
MFFFRRRSSMRYFMTVFIPLLAFCVVTETRGQENVYKAVVDADGVQKAEVLAGEYFFRPDHIIVKVNVPVELKIRKEPGIVPHDFVLKAPEAGIDVLESLSSEPKSVRFTPAKTGTYQFYCDKKLIFSKSHREKGMEGTLEVVE